jgi:hypothetical protein
MLITSTLITVTSGVYGNKTMSTSSNKIDSIFESEMYSGSKHVTYCFNYDVKSLLLVLLEAGFIVFQRIFFRALDFF